MQHWWNYFNHLCCSPRVKCPRLLKIALRRWGCCFWKYVLWFCDVNFPFPFYCVCLFANHSVCDQFERSLSCPVTEELLHSYSSYQYSYVEHCNPLQDVWICWYCHLLIVMTIFLKCLCIRQTWRWGGNCSNLIIAPNVIHFVRFTLIQYHVNCSYTFSLFPVFRAVNWITTES